MTDHPDQPPGIVGHEQRATWRRVVAGQARRARRRSPGTRGRVRSSATYSCSIAPHRRECRPGTSAGSDVGIVQPGASPVRSMSVNAADLALPMLMVATRGTRGRQPGSRSPGSTCADRRPRRLRPADRGPPDRRPPGGPGGRRPAEGRRRGRAGSLGGGLDAARRPPGSRRLPRLVHAHRLAQGARSAALAADLVRAIRRRPRRDDRPLEFAAADPAPDALLMSRELESRDRAGRQGAAARAARSVPARRQRRSSLRRDRDPAGHSDRHGEVAHLRSAPPDPPEARSPRPRRPAMNDTATNWTRRSIRSRRALTSA